MAVALAAIERDRARARRQRRAHDPAARPAPAARRQAAARHRAQPRRPHHRGRARRKPAPRSIYRKVRDRASLRVRGVLRRRRGRAGGRRQSRTHGSRSAASPTCRGEPSARRPCCAARQPRPETFAEAADAELDAAQPLRDNAFKVPLARNVLVRTLSELTRVSSRDGTSPSAPPLEPRRRPRQGHRPGALRLRAAGRGRRLRRRASPPPSPPARSTRSTPQRALALPGVLAVISHDNAPAPRRDRRRRAAALPVRHRPLPRADRRRGRRRDARGRPRGAPRRAHRLRAARARRRAAASATRASTSPTRSTRRFPTDTEQGDAEAALEPPRSIVDETYATAADPQQPDGAAREPRAVGGRRPHALRLDPGHVRRPPHRSPRCSTSTRAACAWSPSTSAAASARRARRARSPSSPRSPRRSSSARSRSRSRASRCSPASATARRRSSASASAPTRDGRLTAIAHDAFEQTSTVREFAEQTCIADAHDVRGARPPDPPPARRARRPHAVVDARARRVPGHVRARVGDGRARDRLRPRPDRAADPQRARARPREGHPVLARATSSPACARAPSASAGRTATRPRRARATAAG